MNDWVKVLLPVGLTLLLGFFGFLLNQGRAANCQATNDNRAIMREILLTAPGLDDREDQRFLDRSFELLKPRDCGLL